MKRMNRWSALKSFLSGMGVRREMASGDQRTAEPILARDLPKRAAIQVAML